VAGGTSAEQWKMTSYRHKESYMALWRSISTAFFSVFIMVSAISVVIGGIVIMNVIVGERDLREERSAFGAPLAQRNAISCASSCSKRHTMYRRRNRGHLHGLPGRFGLANLYALPRFVQTWWRSWEYFQFWSRIIFGIYPAIRASRLDPVVP